MDDYDKILLFHITPLDNFASILDCAGIKCKNNITGSYASIAYEGIQDRRSYKYVPISPGGNLHDYVPFYFAPRSPMLLAIHNGWVENCRYAQSEIVYVVTTLKRVIEAGLKYVFTDGHAIMSLSEFYNQPQELDKIDWNLMKVNYWANTEEDGDRKRRRQAEFLIHRFFPMSAVSGLAVYEEAKKQKLNDICNEKGYTIKATVKKDWYY